MRAETYRARATALSNLTLTRPHRHLRLVPTAWSRGDKIELLSNLRRERKEGIVFKRSDAPYTEGRPSSGGTQLKHKFYATLSAIVGMVNAKRSIEIQLFNDEGLVTAGNVTIPPNHPIPTVSEVVEIRYLYAFRESGCLYQPVILGVRSDVGKSECLTSLLKFKNSGDES